MKPQNFCKLEKLLAARAEDPQPEVRPTSRWRETVMVSVRECAAEMRRGRTAAAAAMPIGLLWRLATASIAIAMICVAAYAVTPRQSQSGPFGNIAFDSFENTISTVARL